MASSGSNSSVVTTGSGISSNASGTISEVEAIFNEQFKGDRQGYVDSITKPSFFRRHTSSVLQVALVRASISCYY